AVIVEGDDLATMDDERLADYRRHQVGFVFQSFNLIPTLSARGNVELPLVFAGLARSDRASQATAALESVGLGHRLEHKPTELSGGEQQRVAVARAVVNGPAIILADEPTGNLDTTTGNEILDVIKAMNAEGRTFLITTHDRAVAEAVAHRIVHFIDGSIVEIEQGGLA
ncbi:MAG: ABC transporter ATP-binding protein, partial [Actinomycetota bacterium]|nr:ABC transporter ATP-binding protein [Actinomycetota bacterium]